ncbi:MAG: insulinase family protein [Clostridiales bacterium]|nr:insulinase family protein [Clostridiales bacterium]
MYLNNSDVREKKNDYLKEKYYYVHHKSGLDVYVFPKKMSVSYALFGTRYGSIDNIFRLKGDKEFTEVPDGIAHYLEHKMFENEDGVDTFQRYAKYGASANAYTSFQKTAYLFSCTDNFSENLEILLDFVTHPYYTEQTVAKEQGIIGQEIRMGEDNPGNALAFGLLKDMYAQHSVRKEIAGTVESISHITADLLYRCYNVFYNLNNMSLCVSGDVDPETVLSVCDRVLKQGPELEIETLRESEKPEVFKKRSEKKMKVSRPIFDIGVKNIDISSDPRERMKISAEIGILTNMLFGGSSDFYNQLYKEGLLSSSFGIWNEYNRDYSFITLDGETDDPEVIYDRFAEYVEQVKRDGISEAEFARFKRVAVSDFVKSFDSTSEIANNMQEFIFDGGDILDYADILGSVSAGESFELFRKLFREEYYAMSTVVPVDA